MTLLRSTLLIAAIFLPVTSRAELRPVTVIEPNLGCAITFPGEVKDQIADVKGRWIHGYICQTSQGIYAATFAFKKDGPKFGPTVRKPLRDLFEGNDPPFGKPDKETPIRFGEAPGYAFEGKADNGAPYKARAVQILDHLIVIGFISKDRTIPPECAAFMDSLQITIDGKLPTGKPDLAVHPMSEQCGLFVQPMAGSEPGKPIRIQKSTTFLYTLSDGPRHYRFNAAIPEEEARASMLTRKWMETVRDVFIEQQKIPKSSERTVKIGPVEGIEWDARYEAGGGVRSRTFVLGNALYAFVFGHSTKFDPVQADEFLNSVRLVFRKGE